MKSIHIRHLLVSGAIVGAAALPAGAMAASTPVVVHQGGADGRQSETTVLAHVSDTPARSAKPGAMPQASGPKVESRLATKVAAGAGNEKVRVVITFAEDQRVPRMPEPNTNEPRSSQANVAAKARADALVAELKARRAPAYRQIRGDLERAGATVVDEFWLIKGVAADVPLRAVEALAKRPDVQSIELDDTGAAPPADSDAANDVDDARALMRTDAYFALNQTGGWIGLLDTGVRDTHTLFVNPDHIAFREDLTGGNNPDDDCWNHGTSSAAIITGNGNLGNAFRGVTAITLDSFKVYPASCGGLSGTASVNGFQRAVNVLDRVIVAEMQAGGSETSAISVAADAAYDAGAVVIAANGNNGPNASTVNVPAVAQKALGIGAIDVKSLSTPSYQSLGPAGDGRIKPDVQAPTNVETASSSGNSNTRVFTGTSAATPHAAGAAALLRNFLRGSSTEFPAGNVYSHMIMSGTIAYPFNNTTGAGRLKLPINGNYQYGSTSVANAQTIEIPLTIAASNYQFNAAIWWPEAPATHNDIDLSLVDPSGVVRASSPSVNGVFERVSVNGPLTAGTWKLRIRGYSVPGGSQQVFWSSTQTSP
jgi:serine protease AprX